MKSAFRTPPHLVDLAGWGEYYWGAWRDSVPSSDPERTAARPIEKSDGFRNNLTLGQLACRGSARMIDFLARGLASSMRLRQRLGLESLAGPFGWHPLWLRHWPIGDSLSRAFDI